MLTEEFIAELGRYYEAHGRHDLPWRIPPENLDPYYVMVSEIMLQQTQVPRVLPKYEAFLRQFPNVQALATAPLSDVLIAWQGLGYNRRAKFLWQAAQAVVERYDGNLPTSLEELVRLPGIGRNTAGAILTYAYNQPIVFIETNIRTVYIHHFFRDNREVADVAISELLSQSLTYLAERREWFMQGEQVSYRDFYWALMDYGTYLKASVGNLSRVSKSYAKQSKFEGSRRQIRGAVLRLLASGAVSETDLLLQLSDVRTPTVLDELISEGFIIRAGDSYQLA